MSIGSRPLRAAFVIASLLSASGAAAQNQERYSLQGFGGWTFGKTDNDNTYGYVASEDGEWNNYYFALNLAAQPMEKLSIRSQAFWGEDLRDKRLQLDYVFAQWSQSPALRFRVGKAPVPFGVYTEVYDVGTVRPFYLLPQFYEGPLGLIPKAYVGVGVTGVKPLGEQWEIQYDAFGGEIRFEEFSTDYVSGFDPSTGTPTIGTLRSQIVGREMIGGRLLLAAPEKGLDAGGTVFYANDVRQRIEDGPLQPYSVTENATWVNLRAQYQKNAFAARGEWFGALARDADVKSFYAEASYKLGKHWQLAAQYESSDIELAPGSDDVPEALTHHESFGLALNYWVSPEFVLKLNGYNVDGNMIARPAAAGLRAVLGTIEGTTNVVVVGAQFSF
ncbi:MAG: hypothetical protein AB7O37_09035 [Vicinamibacteria bacterium]